ncbi:MAG: IS1380 family transposase, partial [Desulfosoma sp.]
MGLFSLRKSDFEAAEGVAGDDGFKEALDIQKVPSQESSRQRLGKLASVFERFAGAASVELLERTQVPVTALSTGDVALDLD